MKKQTDYPKFRMLVLTAMLLCCFGFSAIAQESSNKVVIITKTVDEDGNVQINKIVREGADAEDLDIDALLEDVEAGEIEIDIETDISLEDIDLDEIMEIEEEVIRESKSSCSKSKSSCCSKSKSTYKYGNHNPNKAFLGVIVETSSGAAAVKINEVVAGSAAAGAGLAVGDIIEAIDGEAIPNFDQLVTVLSQYEVDDVITIKYLRGANQVTTTATLKAKAKKRTSCHQKADRRFNHGKARGDEGRHNQDQNIQGQNSENGSEGRVDFNDDDDDFRYRRERRRQHTRFINDGPQLGIYIDDAPNGVFIKGAISETGAQDAGLQQGDVIYEVDGEKITDSDDLIKIIKAQEVGDKIKVKYTRDGKNKKAKVTLTESQKRSCKPSACCSGVKPPSCCPSDKSKVRKKIILKKEKIIEQEELKGDSEDVMEEVIEGNNNFNNLNVNNLQLLEMDLFPNPTDGNVTLKFKTRDEVPTRIFVTDINGAVLFEENINNFTGEYNNTIDLARNVDGIYFLNISQNNKLFTEKVILSRN